MTDTPLPEEIEAELQRLPLMLLKAIATALRQARGARYDHTAECGVNAGAACSCMGANMAAAARQARTEALEKAARVCTLRAGISRNERDAAMESRIYELRNIRYDEALRCAEAIRALKETL